MTKLFYNIITKKAMALCSVAMITSVFATEWCKGPWYQEKEPEGLKEFAKRI